MRVFIFIFKGFSLILSESEELIKKSQSKDKKLGILIKRARGLIFENG